MSIILKKKIKTNGLFQMSIKSNKKKVKMFFVVSCVGNTSLTIRLKLQICTVIYL